MFVGIYIEYGILEMPDVSSPTEGAFARNKNRRVPKETSENNIICPRRISSWVSASHR